MKHQANSRCVLSLPVLFAMALVVAPHAASSEEANSLEQFEKIQTTISAVARLLQPSLPPGVGANIDTAIRELGTHLEAIRNAQGKESASPEAAKSLEDHYQRCLRAVKRFSDSTQHLPGMVRVATQEVQTHTFAVTQGKNLLVLWCKGDEKALPSLERIHVAPESPETLTSTQSGEGHHFCFLEFSGLALGDHPYRIEFKGPHPCTQNLIVHVTGSSKLTVRVVEEPGGAPVPCMISLVSLTDFTYRTPQEAVDFDGHFDDGPRIRTLITLGAPYWKEIIASCIEGTGTFEVFSGKWKLSVAKGIEYTPYIEEFELASGEAGEKTVILKRWVDSTSLGWYSGDGHVHTFQQTDDQRKRIATWALANDIRVINTMKMGDINRTYFENAGFGKDYRYFAGDTVLVPGQECPRTAEIGHTQALNLGNGMARDTAQYYLYDVMFDGAHAQGALTGYCHVGWLGFNVNRDMSLNVPRGKVDFFEILQFSQLNPDLWYDFLNLGYKVTACAGSDMPWGGSIGEVRVYAYLGEGDFDTDRWFEAVRSGRTFVSNGPMIDFQVNQARPGDQIDLPQPSQVSIHARAWGNSRIGVPGTLEVVMQGDVLHTATSPVRDSTSPLEINVDLPVESGVWIAARALAPNGAVAHTTPIYITVGGQGFAKKNDMENLLAKRKKSLQEIEELVASEKVRNPTGPISLQGDALLERVGIASRIYEKLEVETTGKAVLFAQ